jgi:ribosomal protein S18 acetylase RimI-like enzyme
MKQTSIELLPTAPENIEDVTRTLNEARNYKLQFDRAWKTEFSVQEITALQQTDTLYAAHRNGSIVGCVQLLKEDPRIWGEAGLDQKALYIHKLATRQSVRGCGIGSAILEAVNAIAQDHEKQLLRLDCPGDNKGLIDYYNEHSFQLVDYIDVPGESNSQTVFHVAKMQKLITST